MVMKKTVSEYSFERDGRAVYLKVFHEMKALEIGPHYAGYSDQFKFHSLGMKQHEKWGVIIDLMKEAWEFGMMELREDKVVEVEYEEPKFDGAVSCRHQFKPEDIVARLSDCRRWKITNVRPWIDDDGKSSPGYDVIQCDNSFKMWFKEEEIVLVYRPEPGYKVGDIGFWAGIGLRKKE